MEELNSLGKQLLDELNRHEIVLNVSDPSYNKVHLISDEQYSFKLIQLYNKYLSHYNELRDEVDILENHSELFYNQLLGIEKYQRNNFISWKHKLEEEKRNLLYEETRDERIRELESGDKEHKKTLESLKKDKYKTVPNIIDLKYKIGAYASIYEMIGYQIEFISKLKRFYNPQNNLIEGDIIYNKSRFRTKINWNRNYDDFVKIVWLLEMHDFIDDITMMGYSKLLSLMNFSEYGLPVNLIDHVTDKLEFSKNGEKIIWKSTKEEFAEFYWELIDNEIIDVHGEKSLKNLVNNLWDIFSFSKSNAVDPKESLRKTISTYKSRKENYKAKESKRNISKLITMHFA